MSLVHAGGVDWNIEWRGRAEQPALALVHGFSGSLRSWERLRPLIEPHFHLLTLDLPGHGNTPLPEKRNFSLHDLWEALSKLLMELSPEPPLLCGYSMGGRIALHVGIHSPEFLRGLILLGASPGIENANAREARRQSDAKLAEDIRRNGSAWFADYWGNLPLFASQKNLPPDLQAELRSARAQCDPRGLAFALEWFGTGRQDYLVNELHRVTCPLLLLAGALDEKFCASNRVIENQCGSAVVRRAEIAAAGHAAQIEKPEAVARAIIEFAESLPTPLDPSGNGER
ncbi:MAG: 2-succinyl-6-hydroxy-2,4-cyclohexadiene-1-carboxylate synthase [bacterium]|nr:2-succinyl-6-hydroxy-2,4-cyclohexadiene-1-carboxylate synthase [bacterium]